MNFYHAGCFNKLGMTVFLHSLISDREPPLMQFIGLVHLPHEGHGHAAVDVEYVTGALAQRAIHEHAHGLGDVLGQ